MTNYQKGYRFERKIATYLRRRGYFVVRAGGSKGPADLVGVKKGVETILVQCKAGTGFVDKKEHNELYRVAVQAGARAIIASKEDRKPTIFKVVTGLAVKTGDEEEIVNGVK